MAKASETHVVRTYRTVARASLGLIVPPMILIPAVVWAFWMLQKRSEANQVEPLPLVWCLIPVGFLLLFPLWAKLKSLAFSRYVVTLDSVVEEHGVFGKTTSEIRIQDIRNIVVKQSFLDRLLLFGNVSFSSAAGTDVEVNFPNVSRPSRIKELVRDIQSRLSDGELDDADLKAIHVRAVGAKTVAREEERVAERERNADAKAKEKIARAAAKAKEKADRAAAKAREADGESRAQDTAPATTDTAANASAGEDSEDVPSNAPRAPRPAAATETTSDDAGSDEDSGDELYRLLAEQAAAGKADR